MSESNKKTRDQSIPFVATMFNNSSSAEKGSDYYSVKTSTLLVAVRCSTPDRGTLTEAHLNLLMDVPASTEVYVAIGRFESDSVTAVDPNEYTYDQIKEMHKLITGSDSPIASSGSTLLLDGINIFPLLPKRGSANFNADGFVVMLLFNRSRASSSFVLKRFDVVCSAQMGVL